MSDRSRQVVGRTPRRDAPSGGGAARRSACTRRCGFWDTPAPFPARPWWSRLLTTHCFYTFSRSISRESQGCVGTATQLARLPQHPCIDSAVMWRYVLRQRCHGEVSLPWSERTQSGQEAWIARRRLALGKRAALRSALTCWLDRGGTRHVSLQSKAGPAQGPGCRLTVGSCHATGAARTHGVRPAGVQPCSTHIERLP